MLLLDVAEPIRFSDVQGMIDEEGKSINEYGPWRIRFNTKKVRRSKNGKTELVDVFDPYSFKIGDLSRFSPYRESLSRRHLSKSDALTPRSDFDLQWAEVS